MLFFGKLLPKRSQFGLLLLAMLCISPCRRVPTGARVTFVGEPAPGLLTVAATGRGIGLTAIEQDAVRTALETLLLVGFPESGSARVPMADAQSIPAGWLTQFVGQGRYQSFISGLTRPMESQRRASGGGKSIRYTMTINQQAFRQQLEQQGIIRKLGY